MPSHRPSSRSRSRSRSPSVLPLPPSSLFPPAPPSPEINKKNICPLCNGPDNRQFDFWSDKNPDNEKLCVQCETCGQKMHRGCLYTYINKNNFHDDRLHCPVCVEKRQQPDDDIIFCKKRPDEKTYYLRRRKEASSRRGGRTRTNKTRKFRKTKKTKSTKK
jgi:hypothetical protein